MSDTISCVSIIGYSHVWPRASIEGLKEVFEEHEDDLPADCFLRDLIEDMDNLDGNDCNACSTANDDDAKFCKECGTKFDEEEQTLIIHDLDWSGEDSVATFDSVFVKKIVPLIKGHVECSMLYGDADDQASPWMSTFFIVHDGKIHFVAPDMERVVGAPVFETDEE